MQRRGPSPQERAGSLVWWGGAGGFSEDLTDGRGVAFEVCCLRGCGSQIGFGQGGMLQRHAWPHA